MKNLFCFVLFTISVSQLNAQSEPKEICGYQTEVERILKTKPNFFQWQQAWYQQALGEFADLNSAKRDLVVKDTLYYEIPVVFHVVYRTADENIHDSLMINQIQVLNESFRKLNADTTRIRAIFKNVAADVKIQFKLATVDPNGNASTGITRTNTNISTFATNVWGAYSTFMKDSAGGGRNAWDPTKYMNIWVCNMEYPNFFGVVYGFATPPTGAPNWDNAGNVTKDPNDKETGVVLHYKIVGRNNPFAPVKGSGRYNEGKTAVHEVGHYLGLRHVWGDGSAANGCSVDDGIDDTPNARISNATCSGQNTCNSSSGDLPDQTENYMDYALDGCAGMFTKKQAFVMMYVLRNFRTTLPSLNIVDDTIKTFNYKFNVILFPNPSFKNHLITVRIESNSSNPFNYEVIGMDGRRIIDGQMPKSGSTSMDLNTLAEGLYYFVIKDINGNVVHKQYIVLQ